MRYLLQIQDSISVDTTDIGYRIGYTITSWLPFFLFALVFILIIRKRYKVDK